MQKNKCQDIKRKITENMAPNYQGIINLSDIYRLFSHITSEKEIEQCIDELVNKKTIIKIETEKGKTYIFKEIALKFGSKWKKQKKYLQEQQENLNQSITSLEEKLVALQNLSTIWIDGWNKIITEPKNNSYVINYISSIFYGQKLINISAKIKNNQQKINQINKQIINIEKRVKSSHYTQQEI